MLKICPFAATIHDNDANPVCIDMTFAASYQLLRSCWLEVCPSMDAVGECMGDDASLLRILFGHAGPRSHIASRRPCAGAGNPSHLPSLAAAHATGTPAHCLACRRCVRLAHEIPLFTRYAIKARR